MENLSEMIKASELRVGNWVYSVDRDGDKGYRKVENIHEQGINFFLSSYTVECESYWETDPHPKHDGTWVEGIPLTSEMLERVGFAVGSMIDIVIEQRQDLRRRTILDGNYNGGIKYLHQLQNLYYALTSEELPIEL